MKNYLILMICCYLPINGLAAENCGVPKPIRPFEEDAVDMRLAATKDFQVNVALAYPGTKSASQPVGTDALQARTPDQKSAQARLQIVEDLRNGGLISEKEAEAKRREILKNL